MADQRAACHQRRATISSIDPQLINVLLGAAVGGIIGLSGSVLSASVTAAQGRRARERDAYQEVLRILLRLDRELDREAVAKPGSVMQLHEAIEAQAMEEDEVDRLALVLRVHLIDIRRATDRRAMSMCVDVIYDRQQLGPDPVQLARRAVAAIRTLIDNRVNKSRRPSWLGKSMSEFATDLSWLTESREESYRAQRKWTEERSSATESKSRQQDS